MANDLETINSLIRNGQANKAIAVLNKLLPKQDVPNDEIFFLLGKAYSKIGDWKQALYNYHTATELNPQSPASEALKQMQEILDFYNTDLYNP